MKLELSPYIILAALLAGCASRSTDRGAAPAPVAQQPERVSSAWPVKTRYQIDLWLHGYAMVEDDTTIVPYFQRGYHDKMVALRNKANVTTQLDLNRDRLRSRLATNRELIGGQFLALYFGSWEDMQGAIDVFLRTEGNPRRVGDPQQQAMVAALAGTFRSAADRDWLRLYTSSLGDESSKFYRSYWSQQQRERAGVLTAVDSLWEKTYLPKFQRYLSNTQLARGDFFLSLPLDGEGRTITGRGGQNEIAVTFPDSQSTAVQAIYVFAHEAVAPVASVAVNDNTTPTEKREGVADRYSSAAAVRGGALLMKRVAPELLAGYERYYLQSANVRVSDGDAEATLARAFPLPAPILDAIGRQLDVVLGGI